MKTHTVPSTHRLAPPADARSIAPLWHAFARERAAADPSTILKPNFDFTQYVTRQLEKPNTRCWVLESIPTDIDLSASKPSTEKLERNLPSFAPPASPASSASEAPDAPETPQTPIVGFFFTYTYDETPPPNCPEDLRQEHEWENPFLPRRVGGVLGLYVHPEHRHAAAIQSLIETGIEYAQQQKLTDIDLLISAEQTGIHRLLERFGFTQAAVQYTKHYDIPTDTPLPSLHSTHPEFPEVQPPEPAALALHDPTTGELIRNPQGEPAFRLPLRDENGELLRTSSGLPVYPDLVRDPQTQQWVFDGDGELVVCPLLRDKDGIVEYRGIPQFHPPAYQRGQLRLQQDDRGNYVFRDVERNPDGSIVYTPDGRPVFQSPFAR